MVKLKGTKLTRTIINLSVFFPFIYTLIMSKLSLNWHKTMLCLCYVYVSCCWWWWWCNSWLCRFIVKTHTLWMSIGRETCQINIAYAMLNKRGSKNPLHDEKENCLCASSCLFLRLFVCFCDLPISLSTLQINYINCKVCFKEKKIQL